METEVEFSVFRQRLYVMKKHDATRLHYDLRLEWNGVLLSWALRDGPGCRAGELREAIEMDDHRTEYWNFQGVHATGTIMLWDRGTWEPDPGFDDIESYLRNGVLRFTLHGEKLRGSWMLTRMSDQQGAARPVWTLCKLTDFFSEDPANHRILVDRPNSILNGKTLEEIAQDWKEGKKKHQRQAKLFDL